MRMLVNGDKITTHKIENYQGSEDRKLNVSPDTQSLDSNLLGVMKKSSLIFLVLLLFFFTFSLDIYIYNSNLGLL